MTGTLRVSRLVGEGSPEEIGRLETFSEFEPVSSARVVTGVGSTACAETATARNRKTARTNNIPGMRQGLLPT
jgi:hypothetical protein